MCIFFPLTLFLLSASSLVTCVFYNCLKKYFVHLCAIIDWIEIIFSSEGFNKESSAGTKSERAPRLFGGPNYREKLFLLQIALFQHSDCFDLCLLSLFGVYLEYLDIILSCTLCISHKEVYLGRAAISLTTPNLNYYYNLFFLFYMLCPSLFMQFIKATAAICNLWLQLHKPLMITASTSIQII